VEAPRIVASYGGQRPKVAAGPALRSGRPNGNVHFPVTSGMALLVLQLGLLRVAAFHSRDRTPVPGLPPQIARQAGTAMRAPRHDIEVMMGDDRTTQTDSVSDDVEKIELAMQVKSALESRGGLHVAAVFWTSTNSTHQKVNLKRRDRARRATPGADRNSIPTTSPWRFSSRSGPSTPPSAPTANSAGCRYPTNRYPRPSSWPCVIAAGCTNA
jgi:hypothetical protein